MNLYYCTYRRHGRLQHISLFGESVEQVQNHMNRGHEDVSVILDLGFGQH